jgi:hypothetical protein
LTEREKGGILQPSNTDAKTGENIFDVLQSTHHAAMVLDTSEMEDYKTLPDFVNLDITKEIIEQVHVAWHLSSSASLGGPDTHTIQQDPQAIQHWLLCLGGTSQEVQHMLARFFGWMSNIFPHWAMF